MATGSNYDYGKESALANEFDAWVGGSDSMPKSLALGLAGCSSHASANCVSSAIRHCAGDTLVLRLESWAGALSSLEELKSGRHCSGRGVERLAWELPGVVARNAEPSGMAPIGAEHCRSLGRAMSAARRVELAMGWGSKIEGSVQSKLDGHFESASSDARRKSSRENLARAMCWMECARCEGSDADSLRDAELEKCLGNPSSWRWAAALSGLGGKFAHVEWGKVRQLMNCALGEHATGTHSVPAKERVACVLSLLAAAGSSVEAYRGRSGDKFGAFALGSLWSNPSKELVEELSLAGAVWGAKDLENLAAQGTKRLEIASRMDSTHVLGAIDAAASHSGVGPFTPKWLGLFRACQSGLRWNYRETEIAEEWGCAIGRWAMQSKWTIEDLKSVQEVWAKACGGSGFNAAKEAAIMRAELGEAPETIGQSELRRRPKTL